MASTPKVRFRSSCHGIQGIRGGEDVPLVPADVPATVERLYRAVAPEGYVERLA